MKKLLHFLVNCCAKETTFFYIRKFFPKKCRFSTKNILALFFHKLAPKMIAGIAARLFIICQGWLTDKIYKRIGRLL